MVKLSRCLTLVLLAAAAAARAQNNARFDLIGPKIEVRVTRGAVTLPIASVPNLQPKDRLWLHPDLPPTQSIRYLMVMVFLRGTTNPPPDSWFTRIESWDKKVRAEGVEVTVPDEAQQAVLFLAPVTGGDFTTLRSAVQGRPGVFVRASQDLNLAGFELGRTEKYLATMHEIPPSEAADPKQLLDHSNRIAGTLALKPNPDCFKLPPDQQYTCLTQVGNQMLLDDGHGQTIVAALTSGASADLIAQSSYTQLAGAGLYSAYVGAIVDVVRIMGSLHTAQYQYIPAIGFPQEQSLNLRLNTPPSFHNPKSVIVIGLPSIQSSTAPPLRPADPKLVSCLEKPGVALPVDGAPLVYSTGFAHDLVLHLNYPAGVQPDPTQPQDIPLSADAYQGGLVLATLPKRHPLPGESVPPAPLPAPANATAAPAAVKANNSPQLTGTIRGAWGFDPFIGPTMPLQNAPGTNWKLVDKDHRLLVSSTATACIQAIALEPAPGIPAKPLLWKQADKPDTVDVALDPATLPAYEPDSLHLTIRQYGEAKPDTVNLTAYSEPAKLSALQFHAGDRVAMLTGAGLNEVSQMHLGGLTFKPAQPQSTSSASGTSSLQLSLPDGVSETKLPAGDKLTAHVDLKDGRTLTVPVTVAAPRPSVTLLSKASVPTPESSSTTPSPRSTSLRIYLASQDDLPINRQIAFSLKSANPFPRNAQIEIASADDSLHTTLSVSAGSLILQDPRTILATLDPLKAFGTSAFGPIRLRAIAPDGTPGDWLPLATLVRLPDLTGLTCPAPPVAPAQPKPTASRKATAPTGANQPVANPALADADASGSTVATLPPTAPPADTDGTAPKSADSASTQTNVPAQATPVPATPPSPCTLTGSGLYLIDAIASDATFTNPTPVPEGFVGSSLSVAPPTGPDLYLRLRDDPTAANSVALPAGPL